MSMYRKEWPCCDSVTETLAWEPEKCPFCYSDQIADLKDLEFYKGHIESIRKVLGVTEDENTVEYVVDLRNRKLSNISDTIPKGWVIERSKLQANRIVVKKYGVGGYVAAKNSTDNIASAILYELADSMLLNTSR